jgi:hypothetical protein
LDRFIRHYLPRRIPNSSFTVIKKESVKKEDLPRDNNIIVKSIAENDIISIWEELSKFGRILLLRVEY